MTWRIEGKRPPTTSTVLTRSHRRSPKKGVRFTYPSGSYSYRVRACSGTAVNDCGAYSSVVSVSVSIAQVPANPPSLSGPATVGADNQFSLSWGGVAHATRYELEQSRNGAGWSNVYSGGALVWTAQRTPATYTYRIRACSDAGCSGYSATHTIIVQPSNS